MKCYRQVSHLIEKCDRSCSLISLKPSRHWRRLPVSFVKRFGERLQPQSLNPAPPLPPKQPCKFHERMACALPKFED